MSKFEINSCNLFGHSVPKGSTEVIIKGHCDYDQILSWDDTCFYYVKNSIVKIDMSECIGCKKVFGSYGISSFSELEEIILPSDLEEVMIQRCTKLKRIAGGQLKRLRVFACPNLSFIENTDSLESILIPATKFTNFAVPDSVHDLSDSFQFCRTLKTVTLPDSVQTLGFNAFGDCSNLTHIFGGRNITKIENGALDGCDKLEYVGFKLSEELKNRLIRLSPESGGKIGIVIYRNYIWSFYDRCFYLSTEPINKELEGRIVEFQTPNYIYFEDAPTGGTYIKREKKYSADNIELFNIENLQTNDDITRAIRTFIKLDSNRKKTKELILYYSNYVDSLDITNIIESYHTVIHQSDHRYIPRKDPYVYIHETTESIHTDSYLKILLPLYEKQGEFDSPYTEEELYYKKEQDEIIRDEAKKKYNRQDHIMYLVDEYNSDYIRQIVEIEKYLSIQLAKERITDYDRLGGRVLKDLSILNEIGIFDSYMTDPRLLSTHIKELHGYFE